MSRSTLVACGAGAVAAAYGVWGLVHGTGVAGWIEQGQAALFGSYSLKVTVLVLTLLVVAIGLLTFIAAEVAWPQQPSATPAAPATPSVKPAAADAPMRWSTAVGVAGSLTLATFACGATLWWWEVRTDRADASAVFLPVALEPAVGVPTAAAAATHLALSGRLLADHALEHRRKAGKDKVEYYLVPVAARDWRSGQAVPYVVRVDRLDTLARSAPTPLLARVDGDIPTVAAQALARGGAPLAEGARLLHWVPSTPDGRPDIPDRSAMELQGNMIVCGIVSLAWWAMMLAMLRASRTPPRAAAAG